MMLIDPEIQIKIDELRYREKVLCEKYIYYSVRDEREALTSVELMLDDISAQIKALEKVKYM